MIQLYNTLTRKKEPFIPQNKEEVTMYVCGPTVYNYIHIGNARSTVAFDTIRRYLEYRGYPVKYVSNFTDVDDKIIRTAKEQAMSPKDLSETFIEAYQEDTAALNVQPACCHPKVTDHIEDIIAFIEELMVKGHAYESDGDVYYRTRSFENYGQLSHQSLDDLEIGASQRTGDEQLKKEDPLDFALWKKVADEKELSWESPWGPGRPGWHIECSVMATKHLGNTIDIHGGGEDLQFPHHENEIAQTEAKTGQPFAKYWLHNGYVTVGEQQEKMSKSLGNFVTAHELLQKEDPQVIRFALATTQYRRPIPFNEKTLASAKSNLQRIRLAVKNSQFRLATAAEALPDDADMLAYIEEIEQRFIQEMDDDINTANGITVIYEFISWINHYIEKESVSAVVLKTLLERLTVMMTIFGIELNEEADTESDERIEGLIQERNEARANRDFARSDEIRDLLKNEGIVLEDTAQGTRWRRE